MSNPYNGSRHGKRGGTAHTPEPRTRTLKYDEEKYLHPPSQAVAVESSAKYNDHYIGEESTDDPVIPAETMRTLVRRSLTKTLHLKLFSPTVEFERLKDTKRVQTAKDGTQVHTTDPNYRVTWKSDQNLLSRQRMETGIGGRLAGGHGFIRVTSRSKRKRVELEEYLPDSEQ